MWDHQAAEPLNTLDCRRKLLRQLKKCAVAFDTFHTSIIRHTNMFFLRVTQLFCFFTSPLLWQDRGQEQEVPGVQEADAAAGQSAPDRSVCVQLSGLAKARLLWE